MSTNMQLITSVTVGSGGAASVTLPATGTIPATYTDLKVVISARLSRATTGGSVVISFNSDTNNGNYQNKFLTGDGATASSGGASTARFIGYWGGSSVTASTFTNTEVYIPNYASTTTYKSYSADNASENNATTAYATLVTGLWSSNSAITSINFSDNGGGDIVEGSTFYLYGISNVTSTTKATGGIVSSDGTYNYHMFPFSSTFTPTENITADYLVIAGGGGGARINGGGGAGGLRSTVGATGGGGSLESALSLTANTGYTVTVGAGGAGAAGSGNGTNGGNSVFSTITSTGGGGGGNYGNPQGTAGSAGGSGGGGGFSDGGSPVASVGGAASPSGQGYAGGGGAASGGVARSGGGGGAGAIGGSANGTNSGAGGAGVAISAFANATQTGVNTYYAGGGAGGSEGGNSAIGGLGGGGNGAARSPFIAGSTGIVNTGGGGGGGENNTPSNGYAGGSGLVIIRYAI